MISTPLIHFRHPTHFNHKCSPGLFNPPTSNSQHFLQISNKKDIFQLESITTNKNGFQWLISTVFILPLLVFSPFFPLLFCFSKSLTALFIALSLNLVKTFVTKIKTLSSYCSGGNFVLRKLTKFSISPRPGLTDPFGCQA